MPEQQKINVRNVISSTVITGILEIEAFKGCINFVQR